MNNRTKTILLTSILLFNACAPVSPTEDERKWDAEIAQLADESFRRAVGYGACKPTDLLNYEVVPYTDGRNVTTFDYDTTGKGVIIVSKIIYIQRYPKEARLHLVSGLDHETAHFCVVEEIYEEPIYIDEEFELIGSAGFTLFARKKETGEVYRLADLEEGRATIYMQNVSINPEEVNQILSDSGGMGYLNVAEFIRLISKGKNISEVTSGFSDWYEAVMGEPLTGGKLKKFIKTVNSVYKLYESPEDAVKTLLND